jgi:hypothetical protein
MLGSYAPRRRTRCTHLPDKMVMEVYACFVSVLSPFWNAYACEYTKQGGLATLRKPELDSGLTGLSGRDPLASVHIMS